MSIKEPQTTLDVEERAVKSYRKMSEKYQQALWDQVCTF